MDFLHGFYVKVESVRWASLARQWIQTPSQSGANVTHFLREGGPRIPMVFTLGILGMIRALCIWQTLVRCLRCLRCTLLGSSVDTVLALALARLHRISKKVTSASEVDTPSVVNVHVRAASKPTLGS